MAIPVVWIPKAKYGYNQNFDVNNDVSEDKYRDVKPLSESNSKKPTWPEMIWRNRHSFLGY
jgi:hypothetical protein